MQIVINDTNDLSDLDLRVLSALVGDSAPAPAAPDTKAAAPAAKSEKAAPKAESKPAAKKAEPQPEPEPETEAEAEEESAPVDEPTMKQAVALATKLVSEGKAAQVKEALAGVGAKRVSEIPEDKVGEFVASLS